MRNKDKEQKKHIKGNSRCYMDRTGGIAGEL